MRAAATLLLVLVVALPAGAQSIDTFFADFTAKWVRGDPNLATRAAYFKGEEQDRLDRRLTPLTREYTLERIALAKKGLEQLRKFDRSAMTDVQRVSADVMVWELQAVVDEEPFLDFGLPPLSQFEGANTIIPDLFLSVHPISSKRDAENYVARLAEVDERMEEAIAEARSREKKGVVPPRFILDATIQQMRRFADPSPGQNPLVTTLARKTENLEGLTADVRAKLLKKAQDLVEEEIYPVWRKGAAVLESQMPRATDEAGLSRFDDGAEAYANRLRFFTTTNLTAEEIHEIGLREVARLEGEMDRVFRQIGRTEGTIAERMAQLQADRMYPDPTSEASREQIIADITAIVRDAEKRAVSLFDIQPKTPVEVRPAPTFLEKNVPAGYWVPPLDGSRPGIYQYPRRLDNMSKVGIRSVSYHEVTPGHHMQVALELENEKLPRFRRVHALSFLSAYGEGWGLCAERLAVEEGWYEGDSEGLLDALDSQLFRARRLVVDTGLHAKGWTRQQAIDYGIPVSEVERYVVWPGQACAYMIGQLKIVELREEAKEQLGERFSLKEFHNLLLTMGSVPLTVLESEVDAFIARRLAEERGGAEAP